MEKFRTLTRLIKSFEDGHDEMENVEKISKQTIIKGCKELQLYFERLESDTAVLLDLLSSLKYLVKHNGNCFLHLKEQGILQLMKDIFQHVISKIPVDGTSATLLNIIEVCTETANVLADVNSNAKSCVVLEFCPLFLDILLQPLSFQTRLEVLKSNNLLLEQCRTKVKEEILNDERNNERLFGLVKAVKIAGDYEFQVGVIECLMRLFPRKSRQQYASRFIQDKEMLDGFMSIKDKDFETDCRLYLNSLNAKSEDPTQGVFSLPCVSAFIGNKELRKPSDAGYEEFWVDFNIGSKRITFFCEQSSLNSQSSIDDMWETVAVYKTDVKQCTCNVVDSLIVIEISLKGPVCDIYRSQHQTVTDNKILVKFDPSLEAHITHAVGYTYNFVEKRHKASEVMQPLKISLKEVEQADSQQEFPMNRPSDSKSLMSGSQEYTAKRCRASIPTIPMTPDSVCGRQPTKDAFDENCRATVTKHLHANNDNVEKKEKLTKVASGIAQNIAGEKNQVKQKSRTEVQNFSTPRTPKKKTRTKQKVKTPVVTVTPPPKKEKRCQKISNFVIEDKELQESNMAQESCQNENGGSHEVIPDSLPQEDFLPDTYMSRKLKASVPNKNDSGIHSDCSMSTTLNSSKNVPFMKEDKKQEEHKNLKPSYNENKTSTQKKSLLSKTKNSSLNAIGDIVANNDIDSTNVTTVDINEKQTLVKLKDHATKEDLKLPTEEVSKDGNVPETCFGFDSLCVEENMECVPDSCEQQDTVDVSVNQVSNKNADKMTKEKKKNSYTNKSSDIRDELGSGKVEDGIIGENKCKTFTEVNSSLKELADLDTGNNIGDDKPVNDLKNNRNNEKQGHKNQQAKKHNKTFDDIHQDSTNATTLRKKKGKSDHKTDAIDDNNSRTRSMRTRRGKVNYKEADSSLVEECQIEEMTEEIGGNGTISESREVLKTPDDTPEKTVSNEVKVKSSLKKKKRSSEADCSDLDKRKNRVSFDLPSSQSQLNDVDQTQRKEGDELPRSNTSITTKYDEFDDSVQIVSESGSSEENCFSNEESVDGNIKKLMPENLSNVTDAKKKVNKNIKEKLHKSENKEESNNLSSSFGILEKMSSLYSSSDSLYIESDDSYNERRYRMEVRDKMKTTGRRPSWSSLKKDAMKIETTDTGYSLDHTNELLSKVAESVVKIQHSDQSSDSVNEDKTVNVNMKGTCRASNTSKSYGKKKEDKSSSKKAKKQCILMEHSSVPPATKAREKSKRKSKVESDEDKIDAVEDSGSDLEKYKNKETGSRKKKEQRSRNENEHLSYTFNESFEELDRDKNFTLQQQRLQGMLKSGGKQIVFERSYLKSKTNMKSVTKFSKLHTSKFSEVNKEKEKAYDPYDFTAQCDNSSMASERIGRKDIMKELKKRQSKQLKNRRNKNQPAAGSLLEEDSCNNEISNENIHGDKSKLVETNLVQDKKTKKWHRVAAESEDLKGIEKHKKCKKSEKNVSKGDETGIEVELQDVCYPDLNEDCGVDDNIDVTETEIPNFDKILKEISLNRMKMKKSFDALSDADNNATPCIINSMSSTPKVGSARRKHYYPLNISVIKTPQSCQTVDSGTDRDSGERAWEKSKKRKGSKRLTSSCHRESLDSDAENVSYRRERRKSRMSTDSVSFLDSSHSKSEKSWILDRKKSPKHKHKCKTYKYKPNKYDKSDFSRTEESQEEDDVPDCEQYLQSPIAISSITCTPAVTPSCKSVGSFHTMDSSICTPISPLRNTRKTAKKEEYDIEVEQTQENYCISLNTESDNKEVMEDFGNMSFSKFSVETPQKHSVDDEESDEELSMLKLLQQNMAMHGDSGFASGPSSEVRPSRSSLKRKYPNIEEHNIVSSASSQAESIEEEKSTFIPKKLFKFCPEVATVTPQTLSVCSSWNDEPGLDGNYLTGLSTSMTAFGADIQKQLQNRKQKIESITKKSLKETQKYLTQTLVEQQQYQANLTDNLQGKMITELKAIEKDIQILYEAEQKAEDFFKYQIGVLRNNQDSQRLRLGNMKEMQTTYVNKGRRVKKNNFSAYNSMKEHLKAEMNNLQKKLVTEAQKDVYMNVRRRLQSLF